MAEKPGDAVVGREWELAALHSFVESVPGGRHALLVEGEAGIGKTTLWLEGVRAAEGKGYRVLQARPAESEARLSYAALSDLVGAAFEETRAALPPPQATALAATLLRVTEAQPADARTIATALLGVLTELSRAGPVVVAVDDLQWLDPASEQALAFAVRRLPPNLGVLVTRRTGAAGRPALGLDQLTGSVELRRVEPGPLTLAALHHVVADRTGTVLARPELSRLAAASGGNPFLALEIVRALPSDASGTAIETALPVPEGIRALATERVRSLSPAAQEAVLVAAALSRPTIATVSDALGEAADALPAIIEAEEKGVLVTDRGRIRFTHPLLASAVSASASDARRRQLHRRLADVVADPEQRARHLAQATTDADEEIAQEVELAARQAMLRGASNAAEELFSAASRLTPSHLGAALAGRRLGAASALLRIGDVTDARAVAGSVATDGLPPALQAQRLALLAEVEWDDGATQLATEHLERALVAAGDDRELTLRILTRLVLVGMPANPARALVHADRAMDLVSEEREPHLLSSILVDRFLAGVLLGQGADRELLQRGLDLEAKTGAATYPHPVPLIWFQCVDELDATRRRHRREDEWARDRGDERLRAERLGYLAMAELQAGHWTLAQQQAEESCDVIGELDVSGRFAYAFAWRSLIDAYRGRVDRARATLGPLVDEAARTEKAWWGAILLSVLGVVEFAAGRHEVVDRALVRKQGLLDGIGIKEGLLDRSEPIHVESLVELGEVGRAREVLTRLEQRGDALPRLWIDVTAPRARALVLAAEGDLEGALVALDQLDASAAARLPFDLGCALLVKGRVLRRLKSRRAAADAFREAVTIFEQLDSPPWEARARNELSQVAPGRQASLELTAAERRVAELAAAGLTNRAVAQAAFMSSKTVEAHLARIYRKLGIRSRAELGARMSEQDRAAGTP